MSRLRSERFGAFRHAPFSVTLAFLVIGIFDGWVEDDDGRDSVYERYHNERFGNYWHADDISSR
jgi:hypothetical protein